MTAPEIEWNDMALTGERLRGHVALRRHWCSVLAVLRPRIELRAWWARGPLIVVDALQVIGDRAGKPLAHQEVRHEFIFDPAGLVARLEAREPPGGAG